MTEPNDGNFANTRPGLSLSPLRAVRYAANGDSLRNLLSPPYDVIDAALRDELLAIDPHNAVALVLPNLGGDPDDPLPYHRAADRLRDWVSAGVLEVDPSPVLYVYEMTAPGGSVTRGLLGAIELRDYEDHVILPHENTMAGPVADRLALMTATEANLEPIYLVYDGGGAASDVVANAAGSPVVETTTPDGTTHRLWVIDDPQVHAAVDLDLSRRQGVIADGHHRYATYLALQRQLHGSTGTWSVGSRSDAARRFLELRPSGPRDTSRSVRGPVHGGAGIGRAARHDRDRSRNQRPVWRASSMPGASPRFSATEPGAQYSGWRIPPSRPGC